MKSYVDHGVGFFELIGRRGEVIQSNQIRISAAGVEERGKIGGVIKTSQETDLIIRRREENHVIGKRRLQTVAVGDVSIVTTVVSFAEVAKPIWNSWSIEEVVFDVGGVDQGEKTEGAAANQIVAEHGRGQIEE